MKNLFYKIFHRDKIINGLIVGLFVPIVFFGSLLLFFESLGVINFEHANETQGMLKPRTLGLISICANVLLMQSFNKIRWYESMRGMAISTFICVALWVLKYLKEIV